VATSTQIVPATRASNPLVLWHLISLDAPTVAALWTWFVARANHILLPFASPLAMAVAVWMLYAADRLLDARLLAVATGSFQTLVGLEARHFFHHRHRRVFLFGIAAAAVALTALLPRLEAAAIRLYLMEGALLVAWFLILHGTRSAHRLPKEIAVGLFFAAAIFIPTVAREPALRIALLPGAMLLAALCSLNCLFIYAWEHDGTDYRGIAEAHATTRLALRHLAGLAASVAIAGAVLAIFDPAAPRVIAVACGLSAVLLLTLDRNRCRLSEVTLRAAADLALLTPLVLLPLLR